MGRRHSGSILGTRPADIVTSRAAARTYRGLLAGAAGRIRTHAYRDGGLICEDRSNRARPRTWRIAADGTLLPDRTYSFGRQAFVSVPAPG